MTENAVQLRFEARGRGVVECVAECRGEVVGGFALWYSMQGRLIGSPPVDEYNATILNGAAVALNEALERLSS